MSCLDTKGKLGRRDTPRPSDLKNRLNLRTQPINAFAEEEEEEEGGENEDKLDGDRGVITEQKTITKVYEEVKIHLNSVSQVMRERIAIVNATGD